MPCSPSRAATASSVAFTPSCGVTAAQAVRYSWAALSANETAFNSPRYDGLSAMVAPFVDATGAVWQNRGSRRPWRSILGRERVVAVLVRRRTAVVLPAWLGQRSGDDPAP